MVYLKQRIGWDGQGTWAFRDSNRLDAGRAPNEPNDSDVPWRFYPSLQLARLLLLKHAVLPTGGVKEAIVSSKVAVLLCITRPSRPEFIKVQVDTGALALARVPIMWLSI